MTSVPVCYSGILSACPIRRSKWHALLTTVIFMPHVSSVGFIRSACIVFRLLKLQSVLMYARHWSRISGRKWKDQKAESVWECSERVFLDEAVHLNLFKALLEPRTHYRINLTLTYEEETWKDIKVQKSQTLLGRAAENHLRSTGGRRNFGNVTLAAR